MVVVSVAWLTKLEDRITSYAEGLINKVSAVPREAELTEDLKQAVRGLMACKIGINLLENKKRVMMTALALGVLAFAAIYLYLGLLFGVTYYGLARVQSIPYSLADALINAVFIPAAYSDLPHNAWIRALGGFHWLFVVVVGVGTIFAYWQKKLAGLSRVAELLRGRLSAEEIKTRLDELWTRVNELDRKAFQPKATPEH